jgi:hypothetical protein
MNSRWITIELTTLRFFSFLQITSPLFQLRKFPVAAYYLPDGGDMILRIVGPLLTRYMASFPQKTELFKIYFDLTNRFQGKDLFRKMRELLFWGYRDSVFLFYGYR